MPELPEVETVRRGLAVALEGRRFARVVAHRPDLRFPLPAGFGQLLTGRRITRLDRRAKYILVHMEGGLVLLMHLGMSGRIVIDRGDAPLALHDHVVFETDAGDRIRFGDPRRFGFMDVFDESAMATHPRLAHLGVEPLDAAFDGRLLARLFQGRTAPLKAALMDQKLVVGVGNIYASEAMYRARLSPRRLAGSVAGLRAERLAVAVRMVLEEAIEAGGSSLRDYVQASGELGYFQHRWAVYGREGEPCPACDCGRGVSRIVQAGRSTFFCAKRQR